VLFTRRGIVKIKNARHREDPRPVDPGCGCPLCSRLSRAFLHHLVRAGEITGQVLSTLHNLRFYLDFMAELRQAIALGTLADLAAQLADRSTGEDLSEGPDSGALPVSADPLEQERS
jgi:queuine tRNA-ribosyltransferase